MDPGIWLQHGEPTRSAADTSPVPCIVDRESDLQDTRLVLKAGLIQQLLEAFGFKHVFDMNCLKPAGGDIVDAFKGSKLFADYSKNIRLFDSWAKTEKELGHRAVMEAVQMVLGSVGLKLNSQRIEKARYSYQLNQDHQQRMALLVKLRLRTLWDATELPQECYWSDALQHLKDVSLQPVAHLLADSQAYDMACETT